MRSTAPLSTGMHIAIPSSGASGGGIGRVIEAQRQFFRYDRIFGILIVIFVIVAIIEQISDAIRRRVL